MKEIGMVVLGQLNTSFYYDAMEPSQNDLDWSIGTRKTPPLIFLLNQSFIALQFIERNSLTVCEFYPQAEYEKLPAGVQAVMVNVVVFVQVVEVEVVVLVYQQKAKNLPDAGCQEL